MATNVTLKSGDRLPSDLTDTILLLPPTGIRPGTVKNWQRVTVRALNSLATISGGAAVSGEDPACLRLMDGCSQVIFERILFAGSAGHGLRATVCDGLAMRACVATGNHLEGAIFGAVPNLLLEDCSFTQNRNPNGDPERRSHGAYCSGLSPNPIVRRCTFSGNSGAGLQFNGVGYSDHIITGALVEECIFDGNGGGGTGHLSCMALRQFTFRRLRFKRTPAGLGTFFDNGNGAAWACFDGTVTDYTADEEGWGWRLLAGSNRITCTPGAGWSPGTPVEPPPIDPPAGMSEAEQTAAIRELQRRVAVLERP